MMTAPPIIEARGLWKRYGLPVPTFLRKAARLITRTGERTETLPWALQDINFTLRRGENLGIIGRNGAGKSTLLKILAGVSPPSEGDYRVEGRVFPMIELQAGVNPDLTGRDNIMLLGAVAGFSASEISKRYNSIAEFSELDEWLVRPVRMYSSGMQARLAFSVATHADADVLLIDEVLGVGDFRFQKKCIDRLERMRLGRNTSIIFVSHNPYQVQRLCDKVLMLDKGTQTHLADAAQTLEIYFNLDSTTDGQSPAETGIILPAPETREGSGRLRITKIEQIDAQDRSVSVFRTGENALLRLHYVTNEPVRNPNFGIRIFDSQNTCLLSFAYTHFMDGRILEGSGFIDFHVEGLPLLSGNYFLQVKASGDELHDMIQSAPGLVVTTDSYVRTATADLGLFYKTASWTICEDEKKAHQERA